MKSDKTETLRSNRTDISLTSLVVLSIVVLFLYVLVEKAGFFAPDGLSILDILFQPFPRYLALLVAFFVALLLFSIIRKRDGKSSFAQQVGVLLILIAALMFSSALWVSYLYRYDGAITLTPFKSLDPFPLNYLEMKRYLGSKSRPPTIGITIKNISFKSKTDPAQLASAVAEINYGGGGIDGFREGSLSSRMPMFLDHTFISIVDAGYRVKYHLANVRGDQLDSGEANLKLIPSGSEDYFSMFGMGYSYALRLYPDYYDNNGVPATKSLNLNNPMFNLKVSRFKVVNYKGLFTTKDHLRFEEVILTLPEVSPWITLRVVADYGIYLFAAGIMFLSAGLLLLLIQRVRRPALQQY